MDLTFMPYNGPWAIKPNQTKTKQNKPIYLSIYLSIYRVSYLFAK